MKKLICSAFVVIMMSLALTESSKALNNPLITPGLVGEEEIAAADVQLQAAKDGHLRDGALRIEYGADALGVSPGVALAWLAGDRTLGLSSGEAEREGILIAVADKDIEGHAARVGFRELRQFLIRTGNMQ